MSGPTSQGHARGQGRWLAALVLFGITFSGVSTAGDDQRNRLREIVQQQCVPHWLQNSDPTPCLSVTVEGRSDPARGFVVLPDRKGGAHFLLIPIEPIDGIESDAAWTPGALNYFQAAWAAARPALAQVVGHEVPRRAVGLAINSKNARSQDQLHIHIECLGERAFNVLAKAASRLGDTWSPIDIDGRPYQTMRVMGASLDRANPFELLADQVPGARASMAAYTLVVAGMEFEDGPGFAVLAGKSVPGGELLLDPSCAVAR